MRTFSSYGHADVIIIGGGISGLSLAWRLCLAGVGVVVLEAGTLGGLAGTINKNGYCMDLGPHSFFSPDHQILQSLLQLFTPQLKSSKRNVKLFFKNKYLHYPFTPLDLMTKMGANGLRSALDFCKQKFQNRRINQTVSVKTWAIQNFGEHLYQIFFKPYTEQFWLTECSRLAGAVIPSSAHHNWINTFQLLCRPDHDREQLPTYYPTTGFGEICDQIGLRVKAGGGQILLQSRVHGIICQKGAFQVKYGNAVVQARQVVSTIPINMLMRLIKPPSGIAAAAARLTFRPLLALGIVLPARSILKCDYLYTLHRPYNRLTDMNAFSPATSPASENILMAEIPSLWGDAIWRAGSEELYALCKQDLIQDGWIEPNEVRALLTVKASHAYPFYRQGYQNDLKHVMAYLDSIPGLTTLGRSGAFKYMDIDQCIRDAFDCADQLN